MENEKICQSCGMSMRGPEDFGTNQDQSKNEDYCSYCFKNGEFTSNISMEEMIETNLKYIDHWNKETGNNFTVEEGRKALLEYLPTLKRWQTQ